MQKETKKGFRWRVNFMIPTSGKEIIVLLTSQPLNSDVLGNRFNEREIRSPSLNVDPFLYLRIYCTHVCQTLAGHFLLKSSFRFLFFLRHSTSVGGPKSTTTLHKKINQHRFLSQPHRVGMNTELIKIFELVLKSFFFFLN